VSVTNGQIANETTFNNAFISRTVDSSTVGQLDLLNADAESGASILNIQRGINSLFSAVGMVGDEDFDFVPAWTHSDVGASDDTVIERVDTLTLQFDLTNGHKHDGTDGDGGVIDVNDLTGARLEGYWTRLTNLTGVSGTSTVVTTNTVIAAGQESSGSTVKGFVTTGSENYCHIRDNASGATNGRAIYDSLGNMVYGRLTKAGAVWTLSYYSLVSGVETAYTMPASSALQVWAQELHDPVTDATSHAIYSEMARIINGLVGSGSGGGGGGSLQWVEDAEAPTMLVENSQLVYCFDAVLGQKLYTVVEVPNTYGGGAQIKMRLKFRSPDSSGNVKIKTVATLNRTATDAYSSTTNQRTSTNSAVTLGAGTVDKYQAVICDLTDSTGKINSVAVSGGDQIYVQLTRDTADTATSPAKVPVYAAEVSFNG
jgi:hypothetical protein